MGMSPKLLRPRASGFDPRSISGLAPARAVQPAPQNYVLSITAVVP